jgi:hypothetical protein
MSDLISEMASDGVDQSDNIDKLNDGQLDGVSGLANRAAELEQLLAKQEQAMKDTKAALHKITDEQLPEALEEMGLQKFTLTDGSEISIKAFEWLRDHEFGDLVKNNVTVTFGRGEDAAAKEFMNLCGSQGYAPDQLQKVEPMTLKAWLRERVEAGDAVPLDLFGAFISQRATIKRSK